MSTARNKQRKDDFHTKTRGTNMTPQALKECAIFAEMLAQEYERSGMTQKSLALKLGLSHKTVSAMVHGRSSVTVETAKKLTTIFGVPISEIIPWTSEYYGLELDTQAPEILDYINDLEPHYQKIALEVLEMIAVNHAKP